ncbi:SDR family NAD(P)-dependent oxidoreductase, partial [Streptomyces californicus]|uniref:SDR family NAD(P)-dependent oxidoreductase n=1 Tax=Streptomyces californicus TaxID=67351 RepID=UPI0036AC7215
MTYRTRLPHRTRGPGALVTGGSRGLGLFMARQLAERGCVVTIAARDADELERAAVRLREETGATVHTAVCDVRDRAAVGALVREVHERDGLDLVIANAGVIQVAPVDAVDAAEFADAMDTMFFGALHTSLERDHTLQMTRITSLSAGYQA